MAYNYNNYGAGYPYNNYYGAYPTQPVQPQQATQTLPLQISYVNGIEGAKAFNVRPNENWFLVDNDAGLVYVKSSNQLGQANIQYFTINQIDETKAKQMIQGNTGTTIDTFKYVLKEDFDNLSKEFRDFVKEMKKE
jgi:Na+-transporting NADH:ubiquinone oxidoreductase subunit NqrF